MKQHWKEMHPEKLARIQAWLGDTDQKIRAAEILAREGMKGPGEKEAAPAPELREHGDRATQE